MTLVSWCHHDSYVYRLGHCHVGRRRPSCAVYTILAHFGSESCCRLRKTEFFSKLRHFLLIAGFKSFSFARFSTFLGLSFPKPFPFCRKTVVYIILAGTKKNECVCGCRKTIHFWYFFPSFVFSFYRFFKILEMQFLVHMFEISVLQWVAGRSLGRVGPLLKSMKSASGASGKHNFHQICLWHQRRAYFQLWFGNFGNLSLLTFALPL